jgi:microcystin-dependent protein
MSDPYLGEIRAFGFGFNPTGWAQCNGQLLAINQNQALFALLGTTYGGNGITNFQLPDLRGRVALSTGSSPGGSNRVLGQTLGEEGHTLGVNEIPGHSHAVGAAGNNVGVNGTNVPSSTVVPGTGYSSGTGNPAVPIYANGAPNTPMAPLGPTGNSQAHENRMPYLTANYCIALQGIFPSRN